MSDIQSGTGSGLLAFIDYLREKGYSPIGTTRVWATRCGDVVSMLGFEDTDLRTINVDDELNRYVNLARGSAKDEMLQRRVKEFKLALIRYRKFLNNEDGWKPSQNRGKSQNGNTGVKSQSKEENWRHRFPLRDGQTAFEATFPIDIRASEMDRIKAWLGTLAQPDEDQLALPVPRTPPALPAP